MSRVRVAKLSASASPSHVRVAYLGAHVPDVATSRVRVASLGAHSAGGNKVRIAHLGAHSGGTLVANAGPDLSVAGLDQVTLNGTASTPSTGTILEYEWSQDTAFGGPTVAITNADQALASITAPGVLYSGAVTRFRLRIRDASGWSAYSYVKVTAARHRNFAIQLDSSLRAYRTQISAAPVNRPPTASIGPDLTITLGQTAIIGGTDTDVDGTVMTYAFQVLSGPYVPALTGSGPTRSVTPNTAGAYVLRKVVTDDKGLASAPDDMTLTVLPLSFTDGTTMPDATNTGRDAQGVRGAFQFVVNGDKTFSVAGDYADYDIRGLCKVTVPGVHLHHSRIRGRMLTSGAGVQLLFIGAGCTGSVVEFCDIYYEPAVGIESDQAALTAVFAYAVNAVQIRSGLVNRCNIHHACDTAQMFDNGPRMRCNYLHTNIHLLADPAWNGAGSHDDGIQDEGGDDHEIFGNNIEGGFNGGIQFTQNYALNRRMNCSRNWVGRGGAHMNFSEKGRGPYTGMRVLDNRFREDQKLPDFDVLIGPTSYDTGNPALNAANDNVFSGNIKLTTGGPASIHKGAS